jgi:acetylornithine deacetylase
VADDVVRWLERLVAHPTTADQPILACASDIATRCEQLGFRVERFLDPVDATKCTVVASIGPAGTDGLVLSGHMDVVPTDGQPWTSDPFRLTRRDDRLVGRGSADMKGFIAATLCALERLRPDDYVRELVLVWTHDEEIGCKGSAAFVDAVLADPSSRRFPTATLIGEPTSFQVLRMHPGHVAVAFDVAGLAAHSSRPDLGINAIEGVADVIRVVRDVAAELAQEPADLPELERPVVAVNVARVHGGTAINIVPDAARVEIGYRPLPGQDAHTVFHRLHERVGALGFGDRLGAEVIRTTPAMLTPSGTPLEATLCAHAAHPHVGAATFATDGGNLARLGMQPLVFGPGDINVAHKADEFVPVAELHRAVDVIEAVVRRHCC